MSQVKIALSTAVLSIWITAAGPTPFLGDPVTSSVVNAVGRLRVIDLNHDGSLDVVLAACDDASGDNLVATYAVNGALQVTETGRSATSCPRDILVQDFDGDGVTDVFAGAWDGQGPLPPSFLRGQAAGGLAAAVRPINYGLDHNWSGFASITDGDFDGLPDIALPYDDSDSLPTKWGMTIFSGVDFQEIADISFGDLHPGNPIGAMDVNGDGLRDVVFADHSVVACGRADCTARFLVATNASLGVPRLTTMSRVIDYDSDGALDLLLVEEASAMRVCLTRGGAVCSETLTVPMNLPEAPRKIAVRDFNHDGVNDFVASSGDRLAFSVSREDGGFDVLSGPTNGGRHVTGLVVRDLNHDRKNDLIVSYGSELDIYPGR